MKQERKDENNGITIHKNLKNNQSSYDTSQTFSPSTDKTLIHDYCMSFLVNQLVSPNQDEIVIKGRSQNLSLEIKGGRDTPVYSYKAESTKVTRKKQQNNKKEEQKAEKYIIEEDGVLLGNKKQKQIKLKIKLECVVISEDNIPFEMIKKISIMKNDAKKVEKILTISRQGSKDFQLSISSEVCYHQFPLSFYIFAKLVERALKMNSKYYEIPWEKTPHIQEKVMVGSYIFGKIYKKSQHKGQWKERYIVITPQKLFSYKDPQKMEKPSFMINKNKIKEVSTRLDLYENLLIIKLRYGAFMEKQTYFAISMASLLQRNGKNWLFEFYRMLI